MGWLAYSLRFRTCRMRSKARTWGPSGRGCEGCFSVQADGVVGPRTVGRPVSVCLPVGDDRFARRVVERQVGKGGIGIGQRGR